MSNCNLSPSQRLKGVPRASQFSNQNAAEFFSCYGAHTCRNSAYVRYLQSHLAERHVQFNPRNQTAVDFGCGTGWLLPKLAEAGFRSVYGIDRSAHMLSTARENPSAKWFVDNGTLGYAQTPPQIIYGKCALVTMVHVHYHFATEEELKIGLFGPVSSLLTKYGEAILIGGRPITRFKDRLPDGTQYSVLMKGKSHDGRRLKYNVFDVYWSYKKLVEIARSIGLELTMTNNIPIPDGRRHAAFHFQFSTRRTARKIYNP